MVSTLGFLSCNKKHIILFFGGGGTELNLVTTADIPNTCVDAWNTVEGELKSDGDEDERLFLFYTEHVDRCLKSYRWSF